MQVAARRRPGSEEEEHDITTTYRDLGDQVPEAAVDPVERATGGSTKD